MKAIIVEGSPKEIAALVLELQEQQTLEFNIEEFRKSLIRELNNLCLFEDIHCHKDA